MRVRVGAHGSLLRVTKLVQPVKGSLREHSLSIRTPQGLDDLLTFSDPCRCSSRTAPKRFRSVPTPVVSRSAKVAGRGRALEREVDAHLVNVVDDVVPQFVVDLGSSSLVRSRLFRVFL